MPDSCTGSTRTARCSSTALARCTFRRRRVPSHRGCAFVPAVASRVARVRGGELHSSALKLLAAVLDEANCEELLAAARFKSKREVELLLAQRRPQSDVPSVIRKLPQRELVPEPVAGSLQTELLAAAESRPSQTALGGESEAAQR